MAHRPYPDRGRALRQVMRRHRNQLPPAAREARGDTQTALGEMPYVGEYRLSTR